MKFKVTVVEVVEYIREVEAKDYSELKAKLDEDREYTGKCIKKETTEQMYCEVEDDSGKSYPKVKFI